MTDIKKSWQKMSRQLKKMGITYTCVMNARQMQLGTATIMVDLITDPEANIAEANANLNNEADLQRAVANDYDYMKRNRKTYDEIFLPAAIRDMEKDPNKPGNISYYNYCIESMKAWDEGRYREYAYQRHRKMNEENHRQYVESMKSKPSYADQLARAETRYKSLIDLDPVQKFMQEHNATVFMEIVKDRNYERVYARFRYEVSE